MVGVPKSLGCDACRKRKKKCDATTNGCSWCRKINIPCVGYGQKRYLFKDEAPKLKQRHEGYAPLVKRANRKLTPQQQWEILLGLVREPTNDLDRLTQSFVSKASPSIDISHQLVMNFGGFLAEVPRRLGVNEALDAAADLLITAYAGYCAGDLNPSTRTLVKHSHALNSLNKCLNDPIKARSSETLCAAMIMSICQIFMRTMDLTVNHYVGASEIIKHRGISGPKDQFERLLLATLRGPVVIYALFDNRISFTPDEWQNLIMADLNTSNLDGELIFCLAQVPALVSRVEGVRFRRITASNAVGDLHWDTLRLQNEFLEVLHRLRERWDKTRENTKSAETREAYRLLHCHHARMLAFGLSVGILINCLRQSLDPIHQASIIEESTQMAEEIVELAEILILYRPLGSIVLGLFLGIAWIGASSLKLKTKIETIAMVYGEDMYDADNSRSVQDELVLCFDRFVLS